MKCYQNTSYENRIRIVDFHKSDAEISIHNFIIMFNQTPGHLGQPGYKQLLNLRLHTYSHYSIVGIYYTNICLFCVTCADGILRTSIRWLAGFSVSLGNGMGVIKVRIECVLF